MAKKQSGKRQQAEEKIVGASAQDVEDIEVEVVEIEGDLAIEALTAIAQMDLEAAAAYEIGAQVIDDDEIRGALESFRADHLRHVEDLGRLIAARGGTPPQPTGPIGESALTALASAAAGVGGGAAFLAMISNEQLTNSTYNSMTMLDWDAECLAVLERNQEDEHRHLAWLEDNRERVLELTEETLEPAEEPAQP